MNYQNHQKTEDKNSPLFGHEKHFAFKAIHYYIIYIVVPEWLHDDNFKFKKYQKHPGTVTRLLMDYQNHQKIEDKTHLYLAMKSALILKQLLNIVYHLFPNTDDIFTVVNLALFAKLLGLHALLPMQHELWLSVPPPWISYTCFHYVSTKRNLMA